VAAFAGGVRGDVWWEVGRPRLVSIPSVRCVYPTGPARGVRVGYTRPRMDRWREKNGLTVRRLVVLVGVVSVPERSKGGSAPCPHQEKALKSSVKLIPKVDVRASPRVTRRGVLGVVASEESHDVVQMLSREKLRVLIEVVVRWKEAIRRSCGVSRPDEPSRRHGTGVKGKTGDALICFRGYGDKVR
jgi:hypothetical protein